jgi:transcription elongation factor Elf1
MVNKEVVQMKRFMVVVGLMLVSAMVMAQDAKKDEAKKTELKPQTTCPVMGEEINKSLYVDHDGKRVYVCCKACVSAVTKEPAKYIKKLEDEGITLDKTPAADQTKKESTGAEAVTPKAHDHKNM